MDWNILIVEDEAKLREVLCDFLRSKGEIPAEAADGVRPWACWRSVTLTRSCWIL